MEKLKAQVRCEAGGCLSALLKMRDGGAKHLLH